MKPEYVETATSRDIIAEFFPEHELHSLYSAEKKRLLGDVTVTLHCSCKAPLTFTETDARQKGHDIASIVKRLEKLSQLGRPQ